MAAVVTPEHPASPDATSLIAELDAHLTPLYPSESRHGFSVQKLIADAVAFFVIRDLGGPGHLRRELRHDERPRLRRRVRGGAPVVEQRVALAARPHRRARPAARRCGGRRRDAPSRGPGLSAPVRSLDPP